MVDLAGQLGIGQFAGISRLTLEVERDAVPIACLDVPVNAVVRGIQGAVSKPLGEWGVAPVEDLGRLSLLAKPLGLFGPETLEVRQCLGVGVGRDIGTRRKISGWRKAPVLVEQIGQGLISHDFVSLTSIDDRAGPGLPPWRVVGPSVSAYRRRFQVDSWNLAPPASLTSVGRIASPPSAASPHLRRERTYTCVSIAMHTLQRV